jgi:hypothetical protein
VRILLAACFLATPLAAAAQALQPQPLQSQPLQPQPLQPQPLQPQPLPPPNPLPGAPTSDCNFPDIDPQTPLRITTGNHPIPYQFACGTNRPAGACAVNTLAPGLIVKVGREQNGWACVTGGDSTSGWIPAGHLAPVPATPRAPISAWLGWWRQGIDIKGQQNDRLLITRLPGTSLLHVSGRAFWYGLGDDVHFGEVQADAAPIGLYLHAVESAPNSTDPCIVDLKLNPATQTLSAYDNTQCGGMNVRFSRTWTRYTPKLSSR